MTNKDIKDKTKTSLMDELKSIKGVLNSDDDNIPLLLDDEVSADEDIPVLTSPDEAAINKASLDAAIRQLESMELSPRSNKGRPDKTGETEDPKFDHKATTVRENPFMAKKPTDRFAESRKQAEDALKSVISHSRAISQSSRPAPKEPTPKKSIEFATETTADKTAKPATPASAAFEEDASAEILKLLDEESTVTAELDLDLGDGFGELVDLDVDALISEKPAAQKAPAPASQAGKTNDAQLNAIIDEVVEEYMVILEAALRKKLKEKLPDLLKK